MRLWIVCGPCGCGKSTVASELAERLGCGWVEGDSVHDALASTKMSSGMALSSIDRHIWLSRLKVEILERVRAQQMVQGDGQGNRNFVVTCSALRREYREALRDILGDGSIRSTFVLLQADESALVARVSGRVGHYMKADMVGGQLATYEAPHDDESDVFPICTESRSPGTIAEVVHGLV